MKKQPKTKKTHRAKGMARKTSELRTQTLPDSGRRNFLHLARNIAIAAGVIGGSGYVLAHNVLSTMEEHDLSRIANGTPTVVQIHDPQCSLCLALQSETRKALRQFPEGQLDYVVANIRSNDGRQFANRYGVQHVTLLLFNGKGELEDVLEGQRGSYQLKAAFSRLVVN